MRIAILGAGFAGLSVTWYLLNYTKGTAKIDLYDPEPIGGGASGLSSGLLHAYGGKQAKMSWEGARALKETHRLITEASRALSKPLILSKGILRPALSKDQIENFKKSASTYSDNVWWEKGKCEEAVEGLKLPPEGGGLFIKNGLTLNTKEYLQGLWQACALLGTQYHQQGVILKDELESYDRVLIAMGPLTKNFLPLKDLPINPVKGQIMELEWPLGLKPPPYSLISQKYLVMHPDGKGCTVGATYEHDFVSAKPDPQRAHDEIMPKILEFFPGLKDAKVLKYRAAFRASSKNHLPLVGKISDRDYFFTGLGSKGLLYSAWVGKRVARAMLFQNAKHLPMELYHHL